MQGDTRPLTASASTTLSERIVEQLEAGSYTLRISQPKQNHTWTLG